MSAPAPSAATPARVSTWTRARGNPAIILGSAVCLILVAMALFAPWIAPFDPNKQMLGTQLDDPSAKHWFGLDSYGRDVYSRIVWGARISLWVGVVATLVFTVALAAVLLAWYRRTASQPDARHTELTRLTLVGVLTMWGLYALYHGRQDMVFAFLFVVVVAYRPSQVRPPLPPLAPPVYGGMGRREGGGESLILSPRERALLDGFTWLVFVIWALPLYDALGTPLYRSVYALTNVIVSFVWAATLFRISSLESPISNLSGIDLWPNPPAS